MLSEPSLTSSVKPVQRLPVILFSEGMAVLASGLGYWPSRARAATLGSGS